MDELDKDIETIDPEDKNGEEVKSSKRKIKTMKNLSDRAELEIKKFLNNKRIVGKFGLVVHNNSLESHLQSNEKFLRRPDFKYSIFDRKGNIIYLIIEIDESQHYRYTQDQENQRLEEIYINSGNVPCVIIRFNPDSYKDFKDYKNNGIYETLERKEENGRYHIVKKLNIEERTKRFKILEKTIETLRQKILQSSFDSEFRYGCIYLYYDGYDELALKRRLRNDTICQTPIKNISELI